MNQRINLLNQSYDFYKDFDFSEGKRYFGDRNNRVCRFCGKTEAEVNFKNDAHIIPELLGNKNFISNYECDECNQKFADILENNLGNFLSFYRAVTQMPGKRGIPKYKKNGSEIQTEDGKLIVSTVIGKEIVSIDEVNKKVHIEVKCEPYVPVGVYKCFYKIFLSLIDEKDIRCFKWAIEWISELTLSESKYLIKPAMIHTALTPKSRWRNPYITIFKRKSKYEYLVPYRNEIPLYVMVIFTGSLVFQLPVFNMDRISKYHIKKVFNVPLPIPQEYNHTNGVSDIDWKYIDLSSSEKIKDGTSEIVMKFEECIKDESIYKMAEDIINKEC